MKLEVGMYVRLDTGKIGKIIYFKERDSYPYSYDRITIDSERYTRTTRNVIKASNNIIDLIEVGDIVVIINGMRKKELMLIKNLDKEIHILNTHKIVSIVTKEQFESMSYKVN